MSTMASPIDCTQSVNEIVRRHPETLAVIEQWGIDTCCGGAHAVEEVVRRHGLDGKLLCDALQSVIRAG